MNSGRRPHWFVNTLRGAAALGAVGMLALVAGAGNDTPAANDGADAAYVPLVKGTVNFNQHIAPIIYSNCSSCHRPGEVAPFSLLTYQDVKKRARQIAEITEQRVMPPWKADSGHEQFLDARRLTNQQIGLIKQWVAEGMPEGKAADRPTPPQFNSGWSLGEPDVVFQPSEPYHLDAEGTDVYRCFVIPTNYTEDRYVAAVEVHPDNRKIVHHVIAYLDNTGQARKLDEADPGPGYTSTGGGIGFSPKLGGLGGWAPGNEPRLLPAGTGIYLPKGADIVLQVHYHKSGKPETDQTKMGVYFCKGAVDKRMRVAPVVYLPLRIPPGDANYTVHSDMTTPADVTVHGVMPHMHLLGREMTVTATLPDGTKKKLVHVPDWDFNWQITYALKDPLPLPTGSKVDVVARYDNTTNNPANPSNPPREVHWGEQTTDEMCIAFIYYTVDAEHLTQGRLAKGFPDGFGAAAFVGNPKGLLQQMVEMFDKNHDGKLDPEERKAMEEFMRRNG